MRADDSSSGIAATSAQASGCWLEPVTAAGHRDLESICVAGGRWVRAFPCAVRCSFMVTRALNEHTAVAAVRRRQMTAYLLLT